MIQRFVRLACAFVAGSLATTTSFAVLDWERTVVEITAEPLQGMVSVSFPFTNRGPNPVTLRSIQSDCDCLSANADRTSYASGESGVIRAIFTVGDRLGLHERAILVETKDSPEPIRLAVKVDVPAAAEITPRSFDWKVGAARQSQSAEIVVAPGLHIAFTAAVVTGPNFTAQLREIERGRRYAVEITPKDTSRRSSAAVRIRGRERDTEREIIVSGYAYVR